MEPNEPLEEWQVRAGLDFEVERRPVYTRDSDGQHKLIDNTLALVRNDTDATLSIVSDRYKVVQPREVIEFFRELVTHQGFELETAGALAEGKRVWALARVGDSFTLPNSQDQIDSYILLATAYDKQFSTTAQFTSVRVVCNNTLTLSLREGEHGGSSRVIRIPHTMEFDPARVQGELGLLGESWNQFEENVRRLASIPVSKRQVIAFYMELMGYDERDERPKGAQVVKRLLQSYEYGPGQDMKSAKDTLWGIVGGVTYFADHARRAQNNGTRMNSAWFGESANLKQKAWEKARDFAAEYYQEAA